MPRTARSRRRKARQKAARGPQGRPGATNGLPAAPDGHKPVETPYERVLCVCCGAAIPAHAATSSGHCDTCVFIAAIWRDHHGGLPRYQEAEAYDGGSYQVVYNAVEPPRARRKPRVGNGVGPEHYLDLSPMRPSARRGESSGCPMATQKSVGRSMREDFAQITITDAARRLLTSKEAEALDLFLDAGMGIRAIGRRLSIRHNAVHKRLKRALGKCKGRGAMVTMPADEIEALEASGKVVAAL